MEQFYLSLLLVFVSSVIISLFAIFYKHRSQFSYPNLPPGNPGLPYIGESIDFLSAGWKGHPEKFVFDRIAKYSSNIFKTSILGKPFAVFNGSAGNKFLFSNENKLLVAWWPDNVEKVFPSSLGTSSKEEATKMRSMIIQSLKPEALRKYIGTMDALAQRHFASHWEHKDHVSAFSLAKSYTFLLACKLFLSIEDPEHIARFAERFNLLPPGLISIPIDLPGTPFNKAIKAANFIREEMLSIVKQRKIDLAEGKASYTQDILSHMLSVSEKDEQYLSEFNVANNILGLLIAGHDTASTACTFVVKYLSELPQIYDSVYKEQMEIANSKATGELLNWNDIQKMKYSWNVACEVVRLAPPLPGGFREAITDFTFNGFSIPKGWKLYWSAVTTHKNPEYFPEPDKFDPSRFEEEGPAPYTFIPFGGGPRMCPGKEYARLEILIFMHNLVKRFKFQKLIPDEKIIVNPFPMPEKGLPLRLYPHKG